MPRTVEHIVACHKAAAALSKAGKPIWDKKIDIKAILHEDQRNESPEHISAISARIAALVRRKLPASFFDFHHEDYASDLVEAIENMEACTIADLAEDKANGVEAVDMFNGWLEAVYDWADVNRVWLGN